MAYDWNRIYRWIDGDDNSAPQNFKTKEDFINHVRNLDGFSGFYESNEKEFKKGLDYFEGHFKFRFDKKTYTFDNDSDVGEFISDVKNNRKRFKGLPQLYQKEINDLLNDIKEAETNSEVRDIMSDIEEVPKKNRAIEEGIKDRMEWRSYKSKKGRFKAYEYDENTIITFNRTGQMVAKDPKTNRFKKVPEKLYIVGLRGR